MSTHALQAVLVGAIVSCSAVVAVRHVLPGLFRRVQASMARLLSQPHQASLSRALGQWLQPAEARRGGCGSGLGCGSCGGCGTSNASTDGIPLKFSPRHLHRFR